MDYKLILLAAFNYISEYVSKGFQITGDLLNSFSQYLSGVSNEWYVLDKGPVPVLPASAYSNTPTTHVRWVYNNADNVLGAVHSEQPCIKLPFLSASVVSDGVTHSLDDFINDFRIIYDDSKDLTPRHVLLCWAIHNKVWVDEGILNVIDTDGNEHSFDAYGDGGDEWNELLFEDAWGQAVAPPALP